MQPPLPRQLDFISWTGFRRSAYLQSLLFIVGCLLMKCLFTDSRDTHHYRRYDNGVKHQRNIHFQPDENLISPESPEFDTGTPINVTVEKGQTAFFHCKVKNQGANTVSWVRYTPLLNIVSISDGIFIPDNRFTLVRIPGSSDWTLRVVGVRQTDSGTYECQIGTDPKMGRNITLHVVDAMFQSDSEDTRPRIRTTGDEVARAIIKGERETHAGQSLNLTCYIASSATAPSNRLIKWHHNETNDLNYAHTQRSGHQIEIYQSPSGMFSRLFIRHAHNYHAGKYTCSANHAEPTTIFVQIHPSTEPLALKRSSATSLRYAKYGIPVTAAQVFALLLVINSRIKI
ncbi:hypothetical protein BV898_00807 [Hypsibius exemplaris]|uniref:Ig-like domain-containing protein n=1 Tax=Hypsibius exemplaris TaxID=2072580 RepID=A0A1W0XCA8_HYPEX|nr:hypothetical protein BV898_00807 [Hypsibius exemplaris]